MADAEASALRPLQTAVRDVRPAAVRASALGGQLLPHLRLHLRVPVVVRAAAFRVVRAVGPPAKGGADLGVLGLRRGPLRLPHPPVLHHPGVRLRGLLLPELPAPHAGLLRVPEHQLHEGGACGMTKGSTVANRINAI